MNFERNALHGIKNINVVISNIPLNIMAKFLHIGSIKPSRKWHNRFFTHPYHELMIVTKGVIHVSGKEQHFTLSVGDALLYPAGVYHCEKSDENSPVENIFIVFEDSTLSGTAIIPQIPASPVLREMASTLYDLTQNGEEIPFADEYVTLMLKIFSFSPHTEKKSFVKEADDFMLQNIGKPVTLDDLAKLSGKSKYLFLRQYHSETGITPMKKLWDMRCEEALDLLKYSDLTIKEIAFQTGFSDAAHFSRRIKNHCGKTPSEIRKKHL